MLYHECIGFTLSSKFPAFNPSHRVSLCSNVGITIQLVMLTSNIDPSCDASVAMVTGSLCCPVAGAQTPPTIVRFSISDRVGIGDKIVSIPSLTGVDSSDVRYYKDGEFVAVSDQQRM